MSYGMKILYFSTIIMASIFLTNSSPLIMVLIIGLQTLIMCLSIVFIMNTSWFAFILFLVFMGGLMVLFVYITSLASNELFHFSSKNNNFILYTSMFSLSLLMILTFKENQNNKLLNLNIKEMIFKVYSNSSVMLTSMTMIYLLLVLIVAVSITSLYEGPIRSTTKI
uniref:NADH-ubiquinone oxidoreductase chain 6 n=1 Tax=Gomphiocephalus hodgsoni TaxID=221270 RepID=Q85QQ4_GOMHO|nr:NADH dehydrogenase subunit 6 [Gomphiocephalus hodgsoni]AAO43668.1 NADH dehydrogenase subunit 6 [Gomphiocephalus hodgsoni]